MTSLSEGLVGGEVVVVQKAILQEQQENPVGAIKGDLRPEVGFCESTTVGCLTSEEFPQPKV